MMMIFSHVIINNLYTSLDTKKVALSHVAFTNLVLGESWVGRELQLSRLDATEDAPQAIRDVPVIDGRGEEGRVVQVERR